MKKNYSKFSFAVKSAFVLFLFILGSAQTAKACHGVAIVAPTGVAGPTGITITGSSDPATCGCGPYWMEVEVACSPTTFTATPPAPSSTSWGSYPWYHSTLSVPLPENCVLEAYNSIFIPFSQLCPGTTYYWRVREFVEASSSGNGPWSAAFSFTTPGSPPVTTLQATANVYQVCPGSTVQLNATVTGGCPGSFFNYSWLPTTGLSNPNIANPTATVTNLPITYTVTVTGGCVTVTSADDTVRIISGPPPVAGVPTAAPPQVCSGQSSLITLNGNNSNTIQWQVSPNATNWFNVPGGTNPTLNSGPLSSSLYYQAIVTGSGWPGSGCGTATSPPVLVTVAPSPVADAGTNTSVCSGNCTNLTGTGGVTYTWQPGNLSGQTVQVCPTSATTYTLTVVDANGCTGTDQVTVNMSSINVTASPAVSICNGNNTILVASGPSGTNYSWSPSGSLTGANTANPTATPTVTTTYTVTGTNAFGCTDIDSVTVTVTAAPPITVSNDTALCNGGVATLTASGAATYTWQPGNLTGSSITVTPGSTTTYTVTGNTNNCISTDQVTVTISPVPSVYAGPDFAVCQGTQVTLNVSTVATSYSWQPSSSIIGSNTQASVVAQPTTNTSYTVTVVGPGGCISSDTISVSINALPNVSATTTDNSICIGSSTSLSASGASSYTWIPTVGVQNPNQGVTNATPANSTTYSVIGTDANGCTDTATVAITVNPLPDVYIIPTPTECGDTTGAFTDGGVVAGTGPFTYQFNSQTYNSLPINGINAGTYNVTITDANGCVSTTPVTVGTVNTASVVASANPTFGVYPLPVGFGAAGSSGLTNFIWDFGDNGATGTGASSTYTYPSAGTYTVVLTAYNSVPGCAVYDTIIISVVEQAIVELPNVFTPNADANNDNFTATISGVQEIKVEMFDRWGVRVYDMVYSGIAPAPTQYDLWNGKNKGGNVVADGVYYYVINATGYDGKNYPFQGFVHVIKGN
ncbi:MAG: hypothetical protein Fur0041_13670 [Bacteroidia bacterium]